jgi:hypothetical protein
LYRKPFVLEPSRTIHFCAIYPIRPVAKLRRFERRALAAARRMPSNLPTNTFHALQIPGAGSC